MTTTMKILLALVVGIAAGVLVAKSIYKNPEPVPEKDPIDQLMARLDTAHFKTLRPSGNYTAEQDTFQDKMVRLMWKMNGGPKAYDVHDHPTKPISYDSAMAFINNYLESPLELYSRMGNKLAPLQGWFIERDSILEVLKRNPLANGLQLYIGRRSNVGYDPLTIIWVPRTEDKNDPKERKFNNWDPRNDQRPIFRYASSDTIWWHDAHDYLKPCPPDCPPR